MLNVTFDFGTLENSVNKSPTIAILRRVHHDNVTSYTAGKMSVSTAQVLVLLILTFLPPIENDQDRTMPARPQSKLFNRQQ